MQGPAVIREMITARVPVIRPVIAPIKRRLTEVTTSIIALTIETGVGLVRVAVIDRREAEERNSTPLSNPIIAIVDATERDRLLSSSTCIQLRSSQDTERARGRGDHIHTRFNGQLNFSSKKLL